MAAPPLYDLSPIATLLALAALLAVIPLAWITLRHRSAPLPQRRLALTGLILFLTFDLILVGAFTRLTDSGLGCPDWPGCYGQTTPLQAHAEISSAQAAMPSGPVTHKKAWIEMLHRYLASAVGALIVWLTLLAWRDRARATAASQLLSPWWPTLTLVWVCVQGAFGALTVTMKLFPAIVSLHLLGAYLLLAMLVVQVVQWQRLAAASNYAGQPAVASVPAGPRPLRWALAAALVLLAAQATSGAWVSTNYAVLVCGEFPKCQGQWWPAMDMAAALEIWRPLGTHADGSVVSFQALTAIQVLHRLAALVTFVALGGLVLYLRRFPALARPRRYLVGLLLLQLVTGLSNVVLDWPMAAALLHSAGAGALVAVVVWMLALQTASAKEAT